MKIFIILLEKCFCKWRSAFFVRCSTDEWLTLSIIIFSIFYVMSKRTLWWKFAAQFRPNLFIGNHRFSNFLDANWLEAFKFISVLPGELSRMTWWDGDGQPWQVLIMWLWYLLNLGGDKESVVGKMRKTKVGRIRWKVPNIVCH